MWAARFNQQETIQLLTKYGADLNQTTEIGNVLHQSCGEDNPETSLFLLQQEVKLDAIDKNGSTPLHICSINGSISTFLNIVEYYNSQIEKEEDQLKIDAIKEEFKRILNIQNNAGNTILHESVTSERKTFTEKIRRMGLVDESLQNLDRKTARDIENQLKEE